MTTAVDRRQMELDDIAPATKRRGWVKRMMLCSALVADKGAAAASTAGNEDGATRKPRRGGWHALGRSRWKLRVRGGSWSRLPSWNWKRISAGGGWASALLDAAAFRVMYVVEAVVLGLALSCFFCCCGCQI